MCLDSLLLTQVAKQDQHDISCMYPSQDDTELEGPDNMKDEFLKSQL